MSTAPGKGWFLLTQNVRVATHFSQCDEKKPSCGACMRHGRKCETIKPTFGFRTASVIVNESPSVRYPKHLKVVYDQEPHANRDDYEYQKTSHDSHVAEKAVPRPHFDDGVLSSSSLLEHSSSPPLQNLSFSGIMQSFNRSESEILYIAYWEKYCVRALHRFLKQITLPADHHKPLKHALLALSACNFSRSSPERAERESSSAQVIYRPNRQHQLFSQQYYASAVGQIARIINKNAISSPYHTLAALVLFCYLETAMGNFVNFGYHAEGIATFIQAQYTAISSNSIGRELAAAWILARYHNWWLRMNFSTFSFQLSQPSQRLSADFMNLLHSINARRVIVTSVLCESYRISTIALLQLLNGRRTPQITIDKCITSLKAESKKLDDWHSALSQSELPIENPSDTEPVEQSEIRPLLFKSQDLAMNYAYYVSSRIMQYTWSIYELHNSYHGFNDPEKEILTHWMTILLRIVAGLDKEECSRANVYSIGATSLLVACLLRCNNAVLGRWIENWLHEWEALSIFEEGSFPIIQALGVVRLVNEKRANGNNVYMIALPEDDGGGNGKYVSYNSQRIDRISLMGIRRSSGRLYSELIPISLRK